MQFDLFDRLWSLRLKNIREIINGTPEFCYFINGTPKFFYYQWYPRTIERLHFKTFSVKNRLEPLTFFFLLFFNSKHKRKLMVLNDIGRKKLKKDYACKTFNNTRINIDN